MKASHTPGQWSIEADGSISAPTPAGSDVATSRITICEVLSGGVGIEQAQANRRLIAAAPDLLKLASDLVAIREGLENSNSGAEDKACRLAARAVELVAKAAGAAS